MSELDTTRVPRGELAAKRLIEAVKVQGDLAERHYLELKSTLNLATKKDKEKIAKFILGAANRMPDVASTAFEGYALMVVGVEKGAAKGIPTVEMMEISKVVQSYVGAAGPRWDVFWVPIDDSSNKVLFVIVDPPEHGQPPFPCRSNGDSLTNGRIYLRADGETREAKADEIDLLFKRGTAPHQTDVDFNVEVLGEVTSTAIDHGTTLEHYIREKRSLLLATLPSHESPARSSLNGAAAGLFGRTSANSFPLGELTTLARSMSIPEDRTEQEYLASIDHWERNFREVWEQALLKIAASQLTPAILKLTNRTTTFYHDVQLKLHLEGDISAYDYVDNYSAASFSYLELPSPPRKWGPRERGSSQMRV